MARKRTSRKLQKKTVKPRVFSYNTALGTASGAGLGFILAGPVGAGLGAIAGGSAGYIRDNNGNVPLISQGEYNSVVYG